MSYYILPRNHNLIYKSLECIENKTTIKPVVSFSLAEYLYEIKKKYLKKELTGIPLKNTQILTNIYIRLFPERKKVSLNINHYQGLILKC